MENQTKMHGKTCIKIHKSKIFIYDEYLNKYVRAEELLLPADITRDQAVEMFHTYKSKQLSLGDLLLKKFINPKLDLLLPGTKDLNLIHLSRVCDYRYTKNCFSTSSHDQLWCRKDINNNQHCLTLPSVYYSSETIQPPDVTGWAGQFVGEPYTNPRPEYAKSPPSFHSSEKEPNKYKSKRNKENICLYYITEKENSQHVKSITDDDSNKNSHPIKSANLKNVVFKKYGYFLDKAKAVKSKHLPKNKKIKRLTNKQDNRGIKGLTKKTKSGASEFKRICAQLFSNNVLGSAFKKSLLKSNSKTSNENKDIPENVKMKETHQSDIHNGATKNVNSKSLEICSNEDTISLSNTYDVNRIIAKLSMQPLEMDVIDMTNKNSNCKFEKDGGVHQNNNNTNNCIKEVVNKCTNKEKNIISSINSKYNFMIKQKHPSQLCVINNETKSNKNTNVKHVKDDRGAECAEKIAVTKSIDVLKKAQDEDIYPNKIMSLAHNKEDTNITKNTLSPEPNKKSISYAQVMEIKSYNKKQSELINYKKNNDSNIKPITESESIQTQINDKTKFTGSQLKLPSLKCQYIEQNVSEKLKYISQENCFNKANIALEGLKNKHGTYMGFKIYGATSELSMSKDKICKESIDRTKIKNDKPGVNSTKILCNAYQYENEKLCKEGHDPNKSKDIKEHESKVSFNKEKTEMKSINQNPKKCVIQPSENKSICTQVNTMESNTNKIQTSNPLEEYISQKEKNTSQLKKNLECIEEPIVKENKYFKTDKLEEPIVLDNPTCANNEGSQIKETSLTFSDDNSINSKSLNSDANKNVDRNNNIVHGNDCTLQEQKHNNIEQTIRNSNLKEGNTKEKHATEYKKMSDSNTDKLVKNDVKIDNLLLKSEEENEKEVIKQAMKQKTNTSSNSEHGKVKKSTIRAKTAETVIDKPWKRNSSNNSKSICSVLKSYSLLKEDNNERLQIMNASNISVNKVKNYEINSYTHDEKSNPNKLHRVPFAPTVKNQFSLEFQGQNKKMPIKKTQIVKNITYYKSLPNLKNLTLKNVHINNMNKVSMPSIVVAKVSVDGINKDNVKNTINNSKQIKREKYRRISSAHSLEKRLKEIKEKPLKQATRVGIKSFNQSKLLPMTDVYDKMTTVAKHMWRTQPTIETHFKEHSKKKSSMLNNRSDIYNQHIENASKPNKVKHINLSNKFPLGDHRDIVIQCHLKNKNVSTDFKSKLYFKSKSMNDLNSCFKSQRFLTNIINKIESKLDENCQTIDNREIIHKKDKKTFLNKMNDSQRTIINGRLKKYSKTQLPNVKVKNKHLCATDLSKTITGEQENICEQGSTNMSSESNFMTNKSGDKHNATFKKQKYNNKQLQKSNNITEHKKVITEIQKPLSQEPTKHYSRFNNKNKFLNKDLKNISDYKMNKMEDQGKMGNNLTYFNENNYKFLPNNIKTSKANLLNSNFETKVKNLYPDNKHSLTTRDVAKYENTVVKSLKGLLSCTNENKDKAESVSNISNDYNEEAKRKLCIANQKYFGVINDQKHSNENKQVNSDTPDNYERFKNSKKNLIFTCDRQLINNYIVKEDNTNKSVNTANNANETNVRQKQIIGKDNFRIISNKEHINHPIFNEMNSNDRKETINESIKDKIEGSRKLHNFKNIKLVSNCNLVKYGLKQMKSKSHKSKSSNVNNISFASYTSLGNKTNNTLKDAKQNSDKQKLNEKSPFNNYSEYNNFSSKRGNFKYFQRQGKLISKNTEGSLIQKLLPNVNATKTNEYTMENEGKTIKPMIKTQKEITTNNEAMNRKMLTKFNYSSKIMGNHNKKLVSTLNKIKSPESCITEETGKFKEKLLVNIMNVSKKNPNEINKKNEGGKTLSMINKRQGIIKSNQFNHENDETKNIKMLSTYGFNPSLKINKQKSHDNYITENKMGSFKEKIAINIMNVNTTSKSDQNLVNEAEQRKGLLVNKQQEIINHNKFSKENEGKNCKITKCQFNPSTKNENDDPKSLYILNKLKNQENRMHVNTKKTNDYDFGPEGKKGFIPSEQQEIIKHIKFNKKGRDLKNFTNCDFNPGSKQYQYNNPKIDQGKNNDTLNVNETKAINHILVNQEEKNKYLFKKQPEIMKTNKFNNEPNNFMLDTKCEFNSSKKIECNNPKSINKLNKRKSQTSLFSKYKNKLHVSKVNKKKILIFTAKKYDKPTFEGGEESIKLNPSNKSKRKGPMFNAKRSAKQIVEGKIEFVKLNVSNNIKRKRAILTNKIPSKPNVDSKKENKETNINEKNSNCMMYNNLNLKANTFILENTKSTKSKGQGKNIENYNEFN